MTDISTVVAGFWPAVIADSAELPAMFGEEPRISYPPAGDDCGRAALAQILAGMHGWLAGQKASWEPVASTTAGQRVVDEGVLLLQLGDREIPLPVATVADFDGERIGWLRIYHSTWPLSGTHTVRPPLLPARHDLVLSGAVRAYQEALARGDLAAILAAFRPDGCAREPSGGAYSYCGTEKLRDFYGSLFANGGGIGLEHCTLTDDGVRGALEYNAVSWGRAALPPQAGVAVYERGAGGLLAAARIYDDVDPPSTD